MRALRRLLLAVVVLAMVAMLVLFILENQQSVALGFVGWAGPALPVSVLILLGLLVGLLVGPLLGVLLRGLRVSARRG